VDRRCCPSGSGRSTYSGAGQQDDCVVVGRPSTKLTWHRSTLCADGLFVQSSSAVWPKMALWRWDVILRIIITCFC